MSLKKIIYLQSEADFSTLVSTGSLTKDGKTLTYEPDTTDYRVKYEPEAVPVKGVQINGTDLTPDANGKVNIPYASTQNWGVLRTSESLGFKVNASGYANIIKADDSEVQAKTNTYKPIVPANLQLAVDTGVKGSTNYTSFTCEMSDGTTKTLKLYAELV